MTAELRIETPPLALLVEPDHPRPIAHTHTIEGYRRILIREFGLRVPKYVRDHADDAWGAEIQRMVVRYVVGGESRAALAREHHMSPDTCQKYLDGKAFRGYTRPVLRALARLGIGRGKGQRHRVDGRYREIITAQTRVMARLLADPSDRRAQADARLLLAGWEAEPS